MAEAAAEAIAKATARAADEARTEILKKRGPAQRFFGLCLSMSFTEICKADSSAASAVSES